MESQWQVLQPNEHGDWLNQRDEAFGNWIPLEPEKKFDLKTQSFFVAQSLGTATNRDAWVYNFSKTELQQNISKTIGHYNDQLSLRRVGKITDPNRDSALGNWTRDWLNQFKKNKPIEIDQSEFRLAYYRPFVKANTYFEDDLNQERYQIPKLFPTPTTENRVICVSGVGVTKEFSCIITNIIPDLELIGKSQCFPLYYYEDRAKAAPSLFDAAGEPERVRRDGVSDFILGQARARYGERVRKEDVFYYVYGFLHSPEYRERFSADLKKMLPRLPLVESPKDFWAFSQAGRLLADLHLGYDDFSKAPTAEAIGVQVLGAESGQFRVEKMRFPSKTDQGRILYNSYITVENIPPEAYAYIVNGKSAIEWVMERYAITTHKASGIRNDPNDWAAEHGNPRYILDVLLSVIRLSVETVGVVRGLPGLNL
jgi:predicted helicase